MGCGCGGSGSGNIRNWNDFSNEYPQDPLDLISLATVYGVVGTWERVANYARPLGPSPWILTPYTITGECIVSTNGTDQIQNVSDADQWNFRNITTNVASTTAPPLRKVVFMKAGIGWTNSLPITTAATINELQLSFADNAATRGDAQGTIPVIRFLGPVTGATNLLLVLKKPGRFTLGLNAIDNIVPPNYSMLELDIVAV